MTFLTWLEFFSEVHDFIHLNQDDSHIAGHNFKRKENLT